MAKMVYIMVWRVVQNSMKNGFVEHKFHDRVLGVYDSLDTAIKAKEEAGLIGYRHCDGHGVVIKTMTLDKLYLTPNVKDDNERTKERIHFAKELDELEKEITKEMIKNV